MNLRRTARITLIYLTSCIPYHVRAGKSSLYSYEAGGRHQNAWVKTGIVCNRYKDRKFSSICPPSSSPYHPSNIPPKKIRRARQDGILAMRLRQDYSPIPFFKGWAKPGPEPPGISSDVSVGDGETLDALCGHFRIFQLEGGNKYTTDDHLAAWYGTSWCPSARNALDLGSGIGSVGMISAWRLPGTAFVTVEAQEMSVALARKSARFNGLEGRYDIRLGDMRDPNILQDDERFDLITGTPPYFPLEGGEEQLGQPEHPQKLACRFETRGSVADYCHTASRHLALGGLFAIAFPMAPPWQEQRVFEAAEAAGLVVVRHRPVVLREGDAPLLGLFGMMLKEHLPPDFRSKTWREPPLIVRTKDGSLSLEFSSVRLACGMKPM